MLPHVLANEHAKARCAHAAWDAIAPKRTVEHATRHEADAIVVPHPTKGFRRISHKRLGIA